MTPDPLEIETAPRPGHVVIWLHGLGADGYDFEGVVPALGGGVALRVVLPHAPVRGITVNGGMEMRGWYDITGVDLERGEDRDGIEQSAGLLGGLIARENRRGVRSENIFLAGFSQGGAVVLHAGLRFAERLAGLIVLSAYLPLAASLESEKTGSNQHTPIFMAHGVHDPLIPIALARRGERQLAQAGHSVLWREYPIEHGVSAEEIADVAEFLRVHAVARR